MRECGLALGKSNSVDIHESHVSSIHDGMISSGNIRATSEGDKNNDCGSSGYLYMYGGGCKINYVPPIWGDGDKDRVCIYTCTWQVLEFAGQLSRKLGNGTCLCYYIN